LGVGRTRGTRRMGRGQRSREGWATSRDGADTGLWVCGRWCGLWVCAWGWAPRVCCCAAWTAAMAAVVPLLLCPMCHTVGHGQTASHQGLVNHAYLHSTGSELSQVCSDFCVCMWVAVSLCHSFLSVSLKWGHVFVLIACVNQTMGPTVAVGVSCRADGAVCGAVLLVDMEDGCACGGVQGMATQPVRLCVPARQCTALTGPCFCGPFVCYL
jgi:hypothetical protein